MIYFEEISDNDVDFYVDTESEFDLNDEDDLEEMFASVFVSNDLEGNITITAYDDEAEEDIVFFNKDLNDITDRCEDEDREDYTVYHITLNDLTDLDTFKQQGRIKIAFITFDEEGSDE